MTRLVALLLLLASFAGESPAQVEIFLVRHAEKSQTAADPEDPELSAAGQARAESLARALRDASIAAVYATEFKRTQETAAPVAHMARVDLTLLPASETSALVQRLREANGNALVVGHSNTVPEIIKTLGIDEPVTIGETDYDNLFLVRLGDEPGLLRLHY